MSGLPGIEGRVALITGGGRGIGRAIARRLARAGVAVAVNYRRDHDAARDTVAEIERAGGRGLAVQASVDQLDEDQRMVDRVQEELGPIGILVHSAGIASRGRLVIDTDAAELDRVVRTHALAAHQVCRLVLPGMRSLERGDIIMISSAASVVMAARSAPYNMAKAALEALARTLAKEEVSHGIRVNVVAPGLVATEMGDRLVRATMNVEQAADLDDRMPFGRVVRPEDVAEVVAFLVAETGALISGQRIGIDGGQIL